ncbi:PleD family two-component system response regulator [Chroococcidiopsis sp. TS-821]|uniref:response regulator n=1 Tax=Chroococcidiopsis sp. TS-821 TaxID=1378066 RepID=UPI000CEF09BA|nr:response regulator [Chroococcidiopsis sp. TS-821]PPS42196.1 two-component system response regulator [Chroococcidiopsis sp. TS-821]
MGSNKILVIDDSRVIRARLKEMLPPGNFELLEAKDGVEGLKLISQESLSLIMLDFLLPKLSGWEVFQQIQQNHHWQKIPLVLMSGRKEEVLEKIQEPFEYFEFISKPFEQKELVAAIKSAMQKAKLPRKKVVVSNPTVIQEPTVIQGSLDNANLSEIELLNQKITKMQTEINQLKKQMAQLISWLHHRAS